MFVDWSKNNIVHKKKCRNLTTKFPLNFTISTHISKTTCTIKIPSHYPSANQNKYNGNLQ